MADSLVHIAEHVFTLLCQHNHVACVASSQKVAYNCGITVLFIPSGKLCDVTPDLLQEERKTLVL